MKYTRLGLLIGAAVGLVAGCLLFSIFWNWAWLNVADVGAGIGLVVGVVMDNTRQN